jgi:hypothetical protein
VARSSLSKVKVVWSLVGRNGRLHVLGDEFFLTAHTCAEKGLRAAVLEGLCSLETAEIDQERALDCPEHAPGIDLCLPMQSIRRRLTIVLPCLSLPSFTTPYWCAVYGAQCFLLGVCPKPTPYYCYATCISVACATV